LNKYSGHNEFSYSYIPASSVCAFVNSTSLCTSPIIENDAALAGGVGTTLSRSKIATSWGPNGVSLAWNDGPVAALAKPFSATATGLTIGSGGTTGSANDFIQSIIVGNYAPSNAALRSGTNAWSPTFERFIGDSLTVSDHSLNPYPNQLVALFNGGNEAYPLKNLGIDGELAQTMAANWATADAPIRDPTIPKCVDFIWAGTNDIAGGTETNAQIEGYLSSLWASSISQGCLPVAFTILPRSGGLIVSAGTFETDRQAINTWIRAQSASYAALVDVGADATIGQAGDESNATYYYSDGTHLLAAGDAIVAADAHAVLAGILY
jgi:lysophospholipase L1-like esterase